MTYHEWGDEDFDWEALNKVVGIFYIFLPQLGRMTCHPKEKYGTLRLDFLSMWDGSLYNLIKPQDLCIRKFPPFWTFWYFKNKTLSEIHKYLRNSRLVKLYTNIIDRIIKFTYFKIDRKYIVPLLHKLKIIKLMRGYQRFIFNLITWYCVTKYSHIKNEIMWESYFDELLYSWLKKKVNFKNEWSFL